MQQIHQSVSIPQSAEEFEQLCANIYGARFGDPLPKVNGRTGQEQHGIDVLVIRPNAARIGIQCKRYVLAELRTDDLVKDIERADLAGWSISTLVFATTALRDTKLVQWSEQISDQRLRAGKFPIQIEFWKDICNHIFAYPELQHQYVPHAPGGILHEVREAQAASNDRAARIESLIASLLKTQNEQIGKGPDVDEHGRKRITAWREYVVRRSIGNARKARPLFMSIAAIGLLSWITLLFKMFASHFALNGAWFFVCMLPFMFGVVFTVICNLLLRQQPVLASPVPRNLLLESNDSGEVYLTRIFANCPQCSAVMRYTFLGPLNGPLYPKLVCPRNGRSHNLDFDYTSMSDAGTDIPTPRS
ncbi:hypothetical protein [Trinickia mobilis]|uniref:hypothetical protein n=1 Tax=Trinickia mobilis TaxID=2816356 RepID=UPI001A8DC276|nr:hypothetical protein [Trinickia mobilis]